MLESLTRISSPIESIRDVVQDSVFAHIGVKQAKSLFTAFEGLCGSGWTLGRRVARVGVQTDFLALSLLIPIS